MVKLKKPHFGQAHEAILESLEVSRGMWREKARTLQRAGRGAQADRARYYAGMLTILIQELE